MTVEQIADSAIRLADANVVRAIQLISTELGRDPRDYVLVPFGGAGPLHAGRIAEDLGIETVVVPQNAGVLSAFGLLASDYSQYDTVTRKMPLDAAAPDAVQVGLRHDAPRSRCAAARGRHGRRADACVHAADALRRPGVRGRGAVDGRSSSTR